MFMRRMRDSAKYVMLVLALAFVGWLVFEGINDMRGGNVGSAANPVVGVVAGEDIHYREWNQFLTSQLDLSRQSGPLTEEETRVIEDRAWELLVNATLLRAELDRLGIRVSDAEIRQAFRTQPPAEMLSHPAFQTDGQFDLEKYRRFFEDPAMDETTLLQLENYYRSLLPRAKLEALVESGIYVSEEEAWEFYRDTNETARVRFVRVDPAAAVPDSMVTVSEAEVRAFYNQRTEDFRRPAQARVNMVTVPLRPTAADSAVAHERAAELRERILAGEAFADVAMAESADSISAADGGFMGRRARSALDPVLADAAFSLPVGRVSEPLATSFGLHLLQVDERSADSVSLRQIFVPVEISFETEGASFDLMDELEGIALRSDLVTAADSLGIPVTTDVALTDGVAFVPGAGALGVAPAWALAPETEIGELSRFFESANGFHVFELLGRQPEGRIPLAEAAPGIRARLAAEKRVEMAAGIAAGLTEAIGQGASLEEAAARFGWTVEESEAFRRGDFVPGLGQGTEAVGAAFGAPIGVPTGVLHAGDAVAVIEVIEREEATRTGFEEVRNILLNQLRFERTVDYVEKWLTALRERTTVEDHRARLTANADAAP